MTEHSTNLKKEYIYSIQVAIASWVYICTNSHESKTHGILDWEAFERTGHYMIYLLTLEIIDNIAQFSYNQIQTGAWNFRELAAQVQSRMTLLSVTTIALLYFGYGLFDRDFLFVTIASLAVNYQEEKVVQLAKSKRPFISYGSGMACSFFEGYLRHILPPDENDYTGFQGSIRTYESTEKVRFPVRQLLLVITKTLHCPPNLAYFNKENRLDLPRLEACKSLKDVEKCVAGVQRRVYRNSAYQIQRPAGADATGAAVAMLPVYLAVECATPLHTLHKVVTNKALYDELLHADPDEIRDDFCSMLDKILRKSVDCRGKCTLVYYDDTNPEENLADILLQKIAELEPKFEDIILDVQSG